MKKILLFLIVLLIGKMDVLGLEVEVKRKDDVIHYTYEERKIGTRQVFKLTFDECSEFDSWLIANLAHIGSFSNEFERNVIQKMILEYANNDYKVNLLDNNGNYIDTLESEKRILEKIKVYDKVPDINENYYEVNLNDKLYVDISNYNSNYFIKDYIMDGLGKEMLLANFNKTGLQKLDFKVSCFRDGSDVISDGVRYKPFSIYVNVLGYKVDFVLPLNGDFTFLVYDLDNNYIKNININENKNTFYYRLDEKFVLKDKGGSIYENVDDIYLLGCDEKFIINANLRRFKVNVKSFLSDIFLEDLLEVDNDFKILDNNYLEVTNCKGDCVLELFYGDYIFVDNKTNNRFFYNIWEDTEVMLFRYYISGIVSNENINEIIINENTVEYEKTGNVYFILNYEINTLEVVVDNKTYELDLFDFDNYFIINNIGVFYNFNLEKKDEVINNDDDKNNNEDLDNSSKDNMNENIEYNEDKNDMENNEDKNDTNSKDVITILVPNTNMKFNKNIFILKKRYDE